MNDESFWVDRDGTAHERCQLFFPSTGESVAFDPGAHPELRWQRESLAYFCGYCGEIWERVVLMDSRGQTRPFEVLSCACAKHPDPYNIPGSLLAGRMEGLLPLLPEGVLRREFEVHLAYYNKTQGESVGQHTGTHGR